MALFAIDQRPDSASLLGPYIPNIAEGLTDVDQNVRNGIVIVLGSMRPTPPEPAIQALVSNLRKPAEHSSLGTGVVFWLTRLRPPRDDLASAIARFMQSNDLTEEDRVNLMLAVTSADQQWGERFIPEVIANLSGKHSVPVRKAAIKALEKIGPVGVAQARAELESMKKDEAEDAELRATARALLAEPSR